MEVSIRHYGISPHEEPGQFIYGIQTSAVLIVEDFELAHDNQDNSAIFQGNFCTRQLLLTLISCYPRQDPSFPLYRWIRNAFAWFIHSEQHQRNFVIQTAQFINGYHGSPGLIAEAALPLRTNKRPAEAELKINQNLH